MIHKRLSVISMPITIRSGCAIKDWTENHIVIVKGLRSAGYAVDHAPDGEEGLSLALTEPYDAAVIDLMLPRRNGLALIREMRAEKGNTPVLILRG